MSNPNPKTQNHKAIPKETISETARPAITSDYAKIRYLEEDIRNLDRVGVSEKFVFEGLPIVGYE